MGDDAQVRHLGDRALAILQAAEADGDRKHALGAIREARACFKLQAKVAGELAPEVNVNVAAATVVGRAAIEDPEARRLVIALRDRQSGHPGDVRELREPRALEAGAPPTTA